MAKAGEQLPGEFAAGDDNYFRVLTTPSPHNRADVLNAALETVTTPYVVVLDPGDLPAPQIDAVAARYALEAEPAVIYTDEQDPEAIVAKPDWSPHLLLGRDYIGRLAFLNTAQVRSAGGWRRSAAAACEWDLLLRLAVDGKVEHVPIIGVRGGHQPTVSMPDAQRVVAEQLNRQAMAATVEVVPDLPLLRVWPTLPVPEDPVTIVIPSGGAHREVDGIERLSLAMCLESLASTTYGNWNAVLVTSEGTDPAVADSARHLLGDRLTVTQTHGPFNFSESINEGVRVSDGKWIVLLNDDTEVVEPRWLERMVSVAQDPSVGVVGAKLTFGDGTIQHVGVVFNDRSLPWHAHIGEPDDFDAGFIKVVDSEFAAVTGACFLVAKETFEEVGGLNPALPGNYNDVDFCLKVRSTGRSVLCTPFAHLRHFESTSRSPGIQPMEEAFMSEHWPNALAMDPKINYRSARC